MDSETILDYAVFQLTPTRTRCDLVLFCGKKSEKLASGLVEPFVSHLQYAKDQIPKGGYSITLRPPPCNNEDDEAPWFTKATFQRFVRFVSTPEILERIMRLEREILQIESSLQSNEILCIEENGHQNEGSSPVSDGITKKSTNSSKSTSEEEDAAAIQENSKVQLQRLMDTRKALLVKEQAMAYARAVVAGYEIETIDDLICFADAFGASRLRSACIDFKDLYKKKHSDDQWMDELAAVQACPVPDFSYMMGTSGIMLAGENPLVRTASSEPLSDSATSDGSKENNSVSEQNPNAHQQLPWMNQIPPYMYGYQMPPYQGYPMPYFPGHAGFPPPKDHKKHKSSKKKEKHSDSKETESSEEDEQITSSDSSSSENDSAEEKKHSSKSQKQNNKKNKKKSSKTVVIRNINYITSQRRNGEDGEVSDEYSSEAVSLDEAASIREGIDNALASLERRNSGSNHHSKVRKNGGKHAQNGGNDYVEQEFESDLNISDGRSASNNPWGAFQNLLLSQEDSGSKDRAKNLDMDSFDDHFVVKNSNGTLSNGAKNDLDFESEKIKKPLTTDDSVLVMQRNGVNGIRDNTLDFTNSEATHHMMKKKIVSEGESALFSHQVEESRPEGLDFSSESARKIPRGEDWFVANSSGNPQSLNNNKQLDFTYDGGFVRKEATKETPVVDDSFIIGSTRSAVDDDGYASQWKTDIITTMFDKTSQMENSSATKDSGTGLSRSMEPDELCMVLVRESHESAASWAPEMDYAAEISFIEADKKPSIVKENDAVKEENGKIANGKKNTKTPTKDMRSKSLSRSRLDSLAKSKTTPASRSAMQKSKLQREEEERKRLEELVIQRQKRIAERTAANNGLSSKLPSKTTPPKLVKSNSTAKKM